jgi:hypothetical protein
MTLIIEGIFKIAPNIEIEFVKDWGYENPEDQIYAFDIREHDEITESYGGFEGKDIQENGMLEHIDGKYHASIKQALSNLTL